MNIVDFIVQLLHICNRPTLSILIPFHSPYTPSVDYAHLSTNYENTSGECTDFFVNYAHNSDDYVNTPNDQANITID
jgi:hypothetical protein